MATINKSIVIKAPIEKVFAYMADPTHAPEYWPNMSDIRNVKELGEGKKSFDWTYKMAGMKIDGSSEVVEYVLNERVVSVGKGGIESRIVWSFSPVQEGMATELTTHTDYTVPMPVLGRLAENLILKQNDKDAETMLLNVKQRMEAPEMVK